MFTGIVSQTSEVIDKQKIEAGLRLTFKRPKNWDDLKKGDSVSTNGVCITVESLDDASYTCLLIPETLSKTSFGTAIPKQVNLERSLRIGDRLDGHFVQGHVDTTGEVTDLSATADGGRSVKISFPESYEELVIAKGSITIDGVALTIVSATQGTLEVALIPYTLKRTTLGNLTKGDKVNLEFDVLGKYIVNSLKLRR